MAAAIVATGSIATANASPIGTLYNTGVDVYGTPLTERTVDGHYTVSYGPSPDNTTTDANVKAVVDDNTFPFPYWISENNTLSAWVSPFGRTTTDGNADGYYLYHTEFFLAVSEDTWISGRWASDNPGIDIFINGAATHQSTNRYDVNGTSSQWYTNFSIEDGFKVGRNTLDFLVKNIQQDGGNPTGPRVEMISDTPDSNPPIPEPTTLTLLGSGLIGLGLLGSRRRRQHA